MKNKFIILTFLLFCFQVFGQETIQLKTIPEFSFKKLQSDGVFDSTTDIVKGKQTLIILFSPSCIHCQLALNHFNNNYDKHLKKIQIILVSQYEAKDVIPFLEKNSPEFLKNKNVELLHDTNFEFAPLFQASSVPTFYLFDKKKNLIAIKKGSVEANQLFNLIK